MVIDFDKMDLTVIPNFKGGEKNTCAKMYTDENGKIMRGYLEPGASIGLHTHTANYEVVYILSGKGKMLYDGGEEILGPGSCSYCPPGHEHSLVNPDGPENLEFFAVVPEK